jgi:hypothetical protein
MCPLKISPRSFEWTNTFSFQGLGAPWTRRHYVPSKHGKALIQWQSASSHNSWIFNKTGVETSKLTKGSRRCTSQEGVCVRGIIASLIYVGARWGRFVNFTPRLLYPPRKNLTSHNEQEAGLDVFDRRAIIFLCQEPSQNSSYVHLHRVGRKSVLQ